MTHLNPDATDLISQNEPCRRKIYLDQAATSCPKAPGVADAVYRYLSGSAVNVNRGPTATPTLWKNRSWIQENSF